MLMQTDKRLKKANFHPSHEVGYKCNQTLGINIININEQTASKSLHHQLHLPSNKWQIALLAASALYVVVEK